MRCRMGIHSWHPWQLFKMNIHEENGTTTPQHMQRRNCSRCGKIQTAELR